MSSFRLAQLETLLRSSRAANQPEIKAALEGLQSELSDRLNKSQPESSDFVHAAVRALSRIRGLGNGSQRLDCLHRCHSFLIHHGNYVAAMDVAEQHYLLATQVRSPSALRISLACLGLACAEAGNIDQALNHYARALELARDLDDQEGQARTLNNVGVAMNYAGLYLEAIPCFERVMSLAQSVWKDDLRRKALANIAQSYYYLEDFDKALKAIKQCVERDREPIDATEHFAQTIREFTFVQVALELRRDDLAQEHAFRCQHHARSSNSDICLIMADLALGRCDVRNGRLENGLTTLEEALARSRSVDSSYRDALIAIVQAYDEAHRLDRALTHADELLHHVRERRTMGLQVLLARPDGGAMDGIRVVDPQTIHVLERKHADLRARVAERGIATTRAEMLERLAIAADLKEDSSGAHGYRVGKLSRLLSAELGWSSERQIQLESAARLHDIGKMGVPDRILGCSISLQGGERRLMQAHTRIGAELLARSNIEELSIAEGIAKCHHEWWDGTGYPDKLCGKRIPIHARIVALADVFDALTHGRPYAEQWSIEQALQAISDRRGFQFDPDLTGRFLDLVERLRIEHPNLDAYLGQASAHSPFRQARDRIRELLDDKEFDKMGPPALIH